MHTCMHTYIRIYIRIDIHALFPVEEFVGQLSRAYFPSVGVCAMCRVHTFKMLAMHLTRARCSEMMRVHTYVCMHMHMILFIYWSSPCFLPLITRLSSVRGGGTRAWVPHAPRRVFRRLEPPPPMHVVCTHVVCVVCTCIVLACTHRVYLLPFLSEPARTCTVRSHCLACNAYASNAVAVLPFIQAHARSMLC
jgi:hypothetical protein